MVSESKQRSPQSRRILVVGEDPGSRETLLEPLRWELYDTQGVPDFEGAQKLIEQGWRPQIVLLESQPDSAGITLLSKFRALLPHSSVLFISEDSSTEAMISGLDCGADDYIVKPFVPLELLARIRTHLRIRDLHEQLVYSNARLKEMVDIDDLTGLYNMRSLYQRLEFEMERARRFDRGACVVMMDMDHFKSVNDGHDHLFGSFVLSEIGKLIKAGTRNIDIPARYGGDEFLIVLTEISEDGARLFCERLRKSIEKHVFTNGEDSIKLTLSIGFAMMPLEDVITPKELVRRADHALYESKHKGRNRVTGYEGDGAKVRRLPLRTPSTAKPPRKKASGG